MEVQEFGEAAEGGTGFEDDKGIDDRVKFTEVDGEEVELVV